MYEVRSFNFLFRLDLVVSGMMIRLLFIVCVVAIACRVNGQTVIVNPDGTHSVVIGSEQTGTPRVIVHPNGQHSVVHTTGSHSVVAGPDGRHTVVVGLDNPQSPRVIVYPDGRHATVHAAGTHSLVAGPDGRHTIILNQLLPAHIPTKKRRQWAVALYCQLEMLRILSSQ